MCSREQRLGKRRASEGRNFNRGSQHRSRDAPVASPGAVCAERIIRGKAGLECFAPHLGFRREKASQDLPAHHAPAQDQKRRAECIARVKKKSDPALIGCSALLRCWQPISRRTIHPRKISLQLLKKARQKGRASDRLRE
jgi:hypothetical protein